MAVPMSLGAYLFVIVAACTPFTLVALNMIENHFARLRNPAGCRQLGLFTRSHLHDQHHWRYNTKAASKNWSIKAIFIYPLKSCYPVELNRGDVVPTGFKYDRQFCFAQRMPATEKAKEHWKFITQRQYPKMTRIKTEIWAPDPNSDDYKADLPYVTSNGCIVVTFPWTPTVSASVDGLKNLGKILVAKLTSFSFAAEPTVSFKIPFEPTPENLAKMKYPVEKVAIWTESPKAYNMTSEIPEDIQEKIMIYLGMKYPLALFRVDAAKYREVYRNAPTKDVAGYQPVTGFADAYPLHILNLASVQDVASRLPKDGSKPAFTKFDALRFRANLYVTGPPAYDEDHWSRIRIGGKLYDTCSRCTRCKLPNNDPMTGIPDKNLPYNVMNKYRQIDAGAKNSPCLGMNLVPMIGEGDEPPKDNHTTVATIKVGDKVELLSTKEHLYIQM